MIDPCPEGPVLEAFAEGRLRDEEIADAEAHLACCLDCAKELERKTRAQLDILVGAGSSIDAWPQATGPTLDFVIRQAAEIGRATTKFNPDWLETLLNPTPPPGAPISFAGYEVLEIAGRGGMSAVLKARDPTLDRVVALKVMLPVTVLDGGFASRFLEEARTVAALQHDHVVAIHHAGIETGIPYLVMPFHPEGTLDQWLRRAPSVAPEDVARVGLQLARALEATHRRGILHRDIKPSNVLLENGLDRVRLADFGLAQSRSAGSIVPAAAGDENPEAARHMVAGTPNHMSPEQARGEAIDRRSDLFGLGAVMFQMATGRLLYEGEALNEILAAARKCDVEPVRQAAPKTPQALARIVDRLLARRADDRFSSASEVVSELERFINTRNRSPSWTKRAAVVALAACLILSAIVFALDATATTAFVNGWLCRRTGDGYYVRGRFGTFPRLREAVTTARPHDIIEARFSDERLVDSFRVGGKPLTIRAARGFTPILIATNNAQPMILVDAPLTLEGLTLWRRGPEENFAALISVEKAPLHLLNCRVLRSSHQGQNVLVGGRLRQHTPGSSQPPYRALLAFQHGSAGLARNCLVVGTPATAFGLRASAAEPTLIEATNSLFVVDRGFRLNREVETGVALRSRNSLYLTSVLLDLDQAAITGGVSVCWENCIVDRAQGALIGLKEYGDGARLRALEWKETSMVYAGQGAYVTEHHHDPIVSETDWNNRMRIGPDDHRLIDRRAFPESRVRSALDLSAVDLDPTILQAASGFDPELIGEGQPYAAFRKDPAYRKWRREVRASASAWEQRHAMNPPRPR